jgi:DNA polymerase-4
MNFCTEQKIKWLYLDINSYFATIEQQLHPELRGKPIAVVPVLADTASVIAASYEAKRCGIKTGTKIYQAKQLCPDLKCIVANQAVYAEYHHKIFKAVDLVLKVDHIFSVDEGACLLTGKYQQEDEALRVAKQIKDIIRSEVGDYISCSIGIAPNRYLAKVASNMQKPNGLVIISPRDLPHKLYSLDIRDLPGAGVKTQERLEKNKINSVRRICELDRQTLKAAWGNIWGEKVWFLLRGVDFAVEESKSKTIGQSKVLAPNSRDRANAKNTLQALVLKAAQRLRAVDLLTNSILITISDDKYVSFKRHAKIVLSSDSSTLLKTSLTSLDIMVNEHNIKCIKKISVSFNGLQKENGQLELLDLRDQQRKIIVSKLLDTINIRLGANTVTLGILPNKYLGKSAAAFSYIPSPND